jgi:hypothetical protein
LHISTATPSGVVTASGAIDQRYLFGNAILLAALVDASRVAVLGRRAFVVDVHVLHGLDEAIQALRVVARILGSVERFNVFRDAAESTENRGMATQWFVEEAVVGGMAT